jgi:hypothetical protein
VVRTAMRFSKKRLAGIATIATTAVYALYRWRRSGGPSDASDDEAAAV